MARRRIFYYFLSFEILFTKVIIIIYIKRCGLDGTLRGNSNIVELLLFIITADSLEDRLVSSSRTLTFESSPSSSSFVLHHTYQFVDWPPEISILYKITIRFQFSESTGLPSQEPTSTRTTEDRWQPPLPRHQNGW